MNDGELGVVAVDTRSAWRRAGCAHAPLLLALRLLTWSTIGSTGFFGPHRRSPWADFRPGQRLITGAKHRQGAKPSRRLAISELPCEAPERRTVRLTVSSRLDGHGARATANRCAPPSPTSCPTSPVPCDTPAPLHPSAAASPAPSVAIDHGDDEQSTHRGAADRRAGVRQLPVAARTAPAPTALPRTMQATTFTAESRSRTARTTTSSSPRWPMRTRAVPMTAVASSCSP